MKKIRLFILLIFFMKNINSYLTMYDLKGLHSIINPEFKQFSIFYGALLFESGYLEKKYNEKSNDAETLLIKKLFHKNNNLFAPTVARNYPSTYLDPVDIASLLLWLEYDTERNLDDIIYLKNKLVQKAKKIYPNNINKETFFRHFNALIKLIIKAKKENAPVYSIFLAILYYNSHSKLDGLEYLNKLRFYIPIIKDNQDIWRLIDKNYNFSFIKNLENNININNLSEEDFFEKVSILYITQKNYFSNFSPKVIQNYYSLIPDCMESVIRELCNRLIYDEDTNKYDTFLLNPKINPNSDFINFYVKYCPDVLKVKDWYVGEIWFNYLSNKTNIEYVNNNGCEMRPTIKNLINSLNNLLNLNAKNLDELCSLLSYENFTISCIKDKIESIDGEINILTFKIEKNSKEIEIEICLNPNPIVWHAWVNIPQRDKKNINNQILENNFINFIEKSDSHNSDLENFSKILKYK